MTKYYPTISQGDINTSLTFSFTAMKPAAPLFAIYSNPLLVLATTCTIVYSFGSEIEEISHTADTKSHDVCTDCKTETKN